MFDRKVYRLESFINNSFVETINELIKFVVSDYKEKIQKDSFSPDKCQIGDISGPNAGFDNPKYIYVTFNYMSNKSWTNAGGYEFCTFILNDDSKVIVRWSVSTSDKCETMNIKLLRYMKLKKINKCDKLSYIKLDLI